MHVSLIERSALPTPPVFSFTFLSTAMIAFQGKYRDADALYARAAEILGENSIKYPTVLNKRAVSLHEQVITNAAAVETDKS